MFFHILFICGLSFVTIENLYNLWHGVSADYKIGIAFLITELLAFAVIINLIFGPKLRKVVGFIKRGAKSNTIAPTTTKGTQQN